MSYVAQAWDNTQPLNTVAAKTAAAEFRELKKYITALPGRDFSANTTLVLSDSGAVLEHPTTDANARTVTVPLVASVAFRKYTTITILNRTANVVSIAGDVGVSLILAGSTTTGTRSVAQNGYAILFYVGNDTWLVSGPGVT
jgi:hypothetical protein